jgi:hypothetical protein
MFDEDDYASLFLADDPLLGAGYPTKSPFAHLPSSAADGGDAAGFALFPFHLPPSAPSPSAGSSSAQSDSADSSSRSAPSPSAASVQSATGVEATLLAAPGGGVDDLFGGGLAGFDLDGSSSGAAGQHVDAGWAGDFGAWGGSSGQAPSTGAGGGGPDTFAFAASPSSAANPTADGAFAQQQQQQQQQLHDPFFDSLDLDLTGFALPPLPDDLAALGAPAGNGAFLPSPPTGFATTQAPTIQPSQQDSVLQQQQQSQAAGAIPSFVLSHIENNPAFPSATAAAPVPAPAGPPANATFSGQGFPPSTVSPSPVPGPAPASASLKRKASSSGGSATSPTAAAAQKPVSDHNAIERKYRDNINDAHVKLRDAVPVLRVLLCAARPQT